MSVVKKKRADKFDSIGTRKNVTEIEVTDYDAENTKTKFGIAKDVLKISNTYSGYSNGQQNLEAYKHVHVMTEIKILILTFERKQQWIKMTEKSLFSSCVGRVHKNIPDKVCKIKFLNVTDRDEHEIDIINNSDCSNKGENKISKISRILVF